MPWANIVGDIPLLSASSFMPCHTFFPSAFRILQRRCFDRRTVDNCHFFFKKIITEKNLFKIVTTTTRLNFFANGAPSHTTTSRPLEKTALRRGPRPVPVRQGGPAYGRSEEDHLSILSPSTTRRLNLPILQSFLRTRFVSPFLTGSV